MINKYKIIIKDNYINIMNYKKSIDIDHNRIEIFLDKARVIISGNNLLVTGIDEYEMVIKGIIKGIDFIE